MLDERRKDAAGDDRLASLRIEREEEASAGGRAWRWIAAVIAVALAAALWLFLSGPAPTSVVTAAAAEVRIEGGGATVLNASGYVTARRQATVSSKMTARVVEVLIEEGMTLDEGQLMARLDDSNTRVAYELAEAQVGAAEAALAETRVRAREAALELERVERLVEVQVGSESDLDAAAASHDALVARLAQQEREVAVARRQVAVWAQQLADTEIRAPFAGVVVSKNAQPGEMISPAAAGGGFTRTGIGTVVDMESLEIEVDVNESYINRVLPGQRVAATLDAYTDWEIPASVIAIVPTADRQRATVKVRIAFDTLDSRILPDMGVKVAFREGADEVARPRPRVVVPAAAVRRVDGREVVFVVNGEVAERRAVTTGGEHEDGIVVLSGVSAGESVITEGPEDLAGGERVEEEAS
jgi:RND family efflux transporter MFP subunit